MKMENSYIKYYPVGNGDTTLIKLQDETTILIDCSIRESCQGEADVYKFDVKADLVESIQKNGNGFPFVDVFVLTHGDQDHCRGFTSNFYQGDPKCYSMANLGKNEILIDVLWFSPEALEDATNDDAIAFWKEARRRIKLHREKSPDKDLAGNRIVIIGYNGKEDLDDLDLVRKVPGEVITKFNEKEQDLFSIFIHAPFQEQCQDEEKDKNYTSIVFQARFKDQQADNEFVARALFGGDADHHAWKMILEQTNKHHNNDALYWDLFLAPHHCSWSYFNDVPYSNYNTPQEHSLRVLKEYRLNGAKVIASSKEILDNDDNPPHYPAKQEYIKKVGSQCFLNTDTYIIKGKTPQPIIYEITKHGPMPPKNKEGTAHVIGTAAGSAASTIQKYG